MINAYKNMFINYFNFKYKTSRKDFWLAFLMNLIISILIANIANVIVSSTGNKSLEILRYIYPIIVFIPFIAIKVRRLHDIGKSGWLELLELIPLLGSVIVLILCALPAKND